jgi:nuclear transport factor 2 (NTF2) superfamily protein
MTTTQEIITPVPGQFYVVKVLKSMYANRLAVVRWKDNAHQDIDRSQFLRGGNDTWTFKNEELQVIRKAQPDEARAWKVLYKNRKNKWGQLHSK